MAFELDLDTNGWTLESAEERHRAAPDSFEIPSLLERTTLGVGSAVKLLFLILGHGEGGDYIQCERMWVTLVEVIDKHYVGTLESQPRTSDVLSPGDRITFGPEHVASTLIPEIDSF